MHTLDGLAVLGTPDVFRVYLLHRSVPELAVVPLDVRDAPRDDGRPRRLRRGLPRPSSFAERTALAIVHRVCHDCRV